MQHSEIFVKPLPPFDNSVGVAAGVCKKKMIVISIILLFLIPWEANCQCTSTYHISEGSSAVNHSDRYHCIDVYSEELSAVIHRCIQLSDFISSAGISACGLHINFNEGYYVLATTDIFVNVSLTMEAATVDSNVTLTCTENERKSLNLSSSIAINLLDETGFPSGHVILRGIRFANCVHSIRMDYVEDVLVENCTIRYVSL